MERPPKFNANKKLNKNIVMWKYLPTGELFESRLAAKKKLGSGFVNGAIKYGDLIFTNDTTLANYEYAIYSTTEKSIRA